MSVPALAFGDVKELIAGRYFWFPLYAQLF